MAVNLKFGVKTRSVIVKGTATIFGTDDVGVAADTLRGQFDEVVIEEKRKRGSDGEAAEEGAE